MKQVDSIVDLKVRATKLLADLLFDNRVGRWVIRRVFWSALDPALAVTILFLRHMGGPMLRSLPQTLRRGLFGVGLMISEVINTPILVRPLGTWIASVMVIAIQEKYGEKACESVSLFLTIGGGERGSAQAVCLGSGCLDDERNCFFPLALVRGPRNESFYNEDKTIFRHHLQLAISCLFLAVMCYREDEEIQCCIQGGMLPDVDFYSVHTGQTETDLDVFVAQDRSWAVFSYRGTEMDTLRDVITSAFMEEPTFFDDDQTMLVRTQYYRQMLHSVNDHKLEGLAVGEPPQTVMELASQLHERHNTQLYCTGHSLGGGLAKMLGSYLADRLGVSPTVITFGSPPVAANQEFIDWFRQHVPANWRFNYGNEFAPMVPPLPYTTHVQMYQLPQLVEALDLENAAPHSRNATELDEHLDRLIDDTAVGNIAVRSQPNTNAEGTATQGKRTQGQHGLARSPTSDFYS